MIKIFKKENKYLAICLLCFITPIILFGRLNINSYQIFTKYIVLLSLSYLLLYIIQNNTIEILFKRTHIGRKWISKFHEVDGDFQIIFLSIIFNGIYSAFHIGAGTVKLQGMNLKVGIGIGGLIYWVSYIGFVLFYVIYIEQKEINYLEDFNHDYEKIERDRKINDIMN